VYRDRRLLNLSKWHLQHILTSEPGAAVNHLHENDVPQSACDDMEKLYQNTFSSAFAVEAGDPGISTYVARTGPDARAVFLFRVRKHGIVVLNAAIPLAADDIEPFLRLVFERYPQVRTVCFASIDAANLHSTFPLLKWGASENYIVTLPPSVAAYQASLSKSTATHMRQNQARLRRHHPDHVFQIYEGAAITERIIDAILGLKDNAGNKTHRLGEKETSWLKKVAGARGFLGISTVNGRICAGTICSHMADNFYTHVIAHDAAFNTYSLGTLNTSLTVCEGIARGGKEFHFLWGAGAWKRRLGARPRALDDVLVFRSRLHILLCLHMVILRDLRAGWRRVNLGLIGAADPARPGGGLVRSGLALWYRLKHAGQRLYATAQRRRA
jgi:hypothetical protein